MSEKKIGMGIIFVYYSGKNVTGKKGREKKIGKGLVRQKMRAYYRQRLLSLFFKFYTYKLGRTVTVWFWCA